MTKIKIFLNSLQIYPIPPPPIHSQFTWLRLKFGTGTNGGHDGAGFVVDTGVGFSVGLGGLK